MAELGNEIEKIIGLNEEEFSIGLRFSDGTDGYVSLDDIFGRPKGLAAEILKGGMFAMCFVENGALAWPNGFELCPDMLHMRLAKKIASRKRSPTGARNGRAARK